MKKKNKTKKQNKTKIAAVFFFFYLIVEFTNNVELENEETEAVNGVNEAAMTRLDE